MVSVDIVLLSREAWSNNMRQLATVPMKSGSRDTMATA